ncbi:MAG: acyl-CoA dehydrogenase family protein, partial [Gammaproteobacteria bacterium]
NSSMEWERSCLLASHLGAMERQLETGIRYAKLRQQFGKPIGKFQSIANKIVDMKLRIEASRLLLYRVGWLKQMGRRAVMEAAIAKLFMSESWIQSSLDAIQIHGGYGYMTETELERELRDAIPGTIYSGTSEIQRVIIADWLGL